MREFNRNDDKLLRSIPRVAERGRARARGELLEASLAAGRRVGEEGVRERAAGRATTEVPELVPLLPFEPDMCD